MTRRIIGLSKEVYGTILTKIPRLIKIDDSCETESGFDVSISDAAIMKSYNNSITFDLGCNMISIFPEDFTEIVLR